MTKCSAPRNSVATSQVFSQGVKVQTDVTWHCQRTWRELRELQCSTMKPWLPWLGLWFALSAVNERLGGGEGRATFVISFAVVLFTFLTLVRVGKRLFISLIVCCVNVHFGRDGSFLLPPYMPIWDLSTWMWEVKWVFNRHKCFSKCKDVFSAFIKAAPVMTIEKRSEKIEEQYQKTDWFKNN